ncbi:glutamate racemase [Bacillus sp. FJAT-50079]|uniref:glutamate racemase n=1 Tax=Bacillus sp. FJAT-50079 TaxID=2833577 RepID=UPI001BCA1E36|nr:glutamate racemase [Bacillus sp. FJAT-50079]MBS4208918.1 glutamate racemase [Bacillus sp. FJAT-50079]
MEQAIGVIDSGVGGLTVAKEIMRQMPNETIYYVGDTARCPYGPRSEHEVRKFTWQMADFLLKKNIKMLVIACNTATAVVLEEMRFYLNIPVIGVISPGSRAALKATENKRIGILGTIGTINSKAYVRELKLINRQVEVVQLACPKFVPIVESFEYQSNVAKKVVAETLKPLQNSGIDTLVLGCTHYPLLGPIIEQVMGSQVKVISSGEETAQEVSTILDFEKILKTSKKPPEHIFYTSGSRAIFSRIATDWLQEETLRIEFARLNTIEKPANV